MGDLHPDQREWFFLHKGKVFTLGLGRKSATETSVSHLEQENTVMATAITFYIISVSSVVGGGKRKRCGIFLPI